MNYTKIYEDLVEKCKVRGIDKKSLDFYTEAHHILPRSLGGTDDKENLVLFTAREHYVAHKLLWYMDKNCVPMQRALWIMSKGFTLTSKQFDVLRHHFSEGNKGEGNPFFNKKHTEESKRKTGAASKGRKQSEESRERTRQANLGSKRSQRARENMSKAARNKKLKPWQTSCVVSNPTSLNIWARADSLYRIWILSDKSSERRFISFYKEFCKTSIKRSSVMFMLKLFRNGFVPNLDLAWLSFRDSYFNEE